MRPLPLFLVSAALFVCGVGFTVIGARDARRTAPAGPPATAVARVATVKQLMSAVAVPTAQAIFDSVQTNVTAKGIEEIFPRNDGEWEALAANAAALAEVGTLLQDDGLAVDRGDWVKMSAALTDAAKQAVAAATAKSTDAVLEAGDAVNRTCDTCHMRYRRE